MFAHTLYCMILCILCIVLLYYATNFLLDDDYVYTGTLYSTFTGYIHRLRGYHGLGHSSYYHSHNSLMMLKDGGELGMYIELLLNT